MISLPNSILQILKKYSDLLSDLDKKTDSVFSSASEIPCKNMCFDCCKQLFPVSFIEAYYISEGLKTLDRSQRRELERTARKINEKILVRSPLQFEKRGVDKSTALKTHAEFAKFLHGIKLDCPALDPKNSAGACIVYKFRNHDCRTMGCSFDVSANTIVGCFRFANLSYLTPKMMDFYYKYPDKMRLDRELIKEVTGGVFTPNILYFTTMCGPILKDYSKENWIEFFERKGVESASEKEKYWVMMDV